MIANAAWMRRRLLDWGKENLRRYPWRTTRDPFRVLIAEILLQRTRADSVASVYRELFDRWPSAVRLAAARTASVAAVIRPLGLAYRAPRIVAVARELSGHRRFPKDPDELMRLPGVGRYVANATAAAALGKRLPTVDGVSARVFRRFFGLPADRLPANDRDLWSVAESLTPRVGVREWNWVVLDLAASVCVSGSPRCDVCPLQARCLERSGHNLAERRLKRF